jgi:hypothetical protein
MHIVGAFFKNIPIAINIGRKGTWNMKGAMSYYKVMKMISIKIEHFIFAQATALIAN